MGWEIGFAIPINQARNVMDQILKNGKVVRGYLGVSIQDVTPAIAKAFKVPETSGALVSDVDSKGPSANSGIKQGDVIVGLNGKPVSGPNNLRLRIAEMAPGSVAHLQVVRNGQSHEIDVKLGELPETTAVASAKRPRFRKVPDLPVSPFTRSRGGGPGAGASQIIVK